MTHVLTLIAADGASLNSAELASSFGAAQWQWLDESVAADFFFDQPPVLATYRDRLDAARIDTILQPVAGREKRLLISDMDSTMIAQECIDELADCVGLKPQVAAITERAMNGELDFHTALTERVALLKDLPETALAEVFAQRITLMPGARTLVQTMRARGAYCLLVSGGFTFFTRRVAEALGFHAEEANRLEITEGKLTGRVIAPILDKQSKLTALQQTAAVQGCATEAVLALGDGANDLPMLLAAGLGVAYHAKPAVQQAAQHRINHTDLRALLYAQAIPKSEWTA